MTTSMLGYLPIREHANTWHHSIRPDAIASLASILLKFTMVKNVIRVLVVDDHEMVRMSIIKMLDQQSDMEVVGAAVNGIEAIKLAQVFNPDIIVMDVIMPELDGIRAAGRIRDLGITSKIIMLSMYHENVLIHQARKNGASAYIDKQQVNNELIPAIRTALDGSSPLPQS